jgi:hypothetical protein
MRLRPAPHIVRCGQQWFVRELPKNRRRTEVPGSSTGRAGAVGRHNTQNRAAVDAGAMEHPPLSHLRALLAARVSLIERQEATQVPSILLAESLTRLLQGMALGAAATMCGLAALLLSWSISG